MTDAVRHETGTREASLVISVNNLSRNTTVMNQARHALGEDYQIADAGGYVAILHPQYGAAAVVSSDNANEAEKAASDLTGLLRAAGLGIRALPFAVSQTTVKPPLVIRSGPQMATDIAVTMGRAASAETEITPSQMAAVLAAIEKGRKALRQRTPSINPQVLAVIEAAIMKVVGNKKILAGGSYVEPEEVASPEFLLPAVLLSALQTWAIPVAAAKGKGGFTMDIAADSSAVLMYKVTGIETSSPLLLFLPVVNIIRRQQRAGEIVLDDCIERFGNFMTTNNLNPDFHQDMSMRIALPEGTE